jgi:acylphosphatase
MPFGHHRYIIRSSIECSGGLRKVAGKEVEQREIYYSGRVQGVGFRYTARSAATRLKVTGFVRNMPDGRVHLVVEGEIEEIERFINSLMAEMGTYVVDIKESIHPATGRFKGFEIRF